MNNTTLKEILLSSEIPEERVQEFLLGLDEVTNAFEAFVQLRPQNVVGKKLLASAWELQTQLFAAQGPEESTSERD